jgi:hypothetical protein
MPMIDEPPWPFLMTPAQHRQWAENARRVNRPDLAKHHERLARAIEMSSGASRHPMPVQCPLCAPTSAGWFDVLSSRHKYGAELRERVDSLNANLAEAERAIAIYREWRKEWRAAAQALSSAGNGCG